MTQAQSSVYWSDAVQRGQAQVLDLLFYITAAKTVTSKNANCVLSAFDAIASQSVINTFLGTTDEFLVAAFDATAMGTDAFAGIVNMSGQCSELLACEASTYSGANGLTVLDSGNVASSALTASTLSAQCAKGANGNLAFRCILTGVDALTSGLIHVKLFYRIK